MKKLEVYNKQTKQLEFKDYDEATSGIASGAYLPKKGESFDVTHPDTGEKGSVPSESLFAALKAGAKLDSFADVKLREWENKYDDAAGGALAATAGAARGLTFGLSDTVATKVLDVDPDTLEGLRTVNPGLSLGGEIAGTAVGLFGTGPLGGAVKGVEAGASIVGKAGSKLATSAVEKLISKEAIKSGVSQSVARATAAKIVPEIIKGGVEGAAYGLGTLNTEAALGNVDYNAESLLSAVGPSALIGGGLGGVFGTFHALKPLASEVGGKVAAGVEKFVNKHQAASQEFGDAVVKRFKGSKTGEKFLNELPDYMKNDLKVAITDTAEDKARKATALQDKALKDISDVSTHLDDLFMQNKLKGSTSKVEVADDALKILEERKRSLVDTFDDLVEDKAASKAAKSAQAMSAKESKAAAKLAAKESEGLAKAQKLELKNVEKLESKAEAALKSAERAELAATKVKTDAARQKAEQIASRARKMADDAVKTAEDARASIAKNLDDTLPGLNMSKEGDAFVMGGKTDDIAAKLDDDITQVTNEAPKMYKEIKRESVRPELKAEYDYIKKQINFYENLKKTGDAYRPRELFEEMRRLADLETGETFKHVIAKDLREAVGMRINQLTLDNAIKMAKPLKEAQRIYDMSKTYGDNIAARAIADSNAKVNGINEAIIFAGTGAVTGGNPLIGAAVALGRRSLNSEARRNLAILFDMHKAIIKTNNFIAKSLDKFFKGAVILKPISARSITESYLSNDLSGQRPVKAKNDEEAIKNLRNNSALFTQQPDRFALISARKRSPYQAYIPATLESADIKAINAIQFLASKLPVRVSGTGVMEALNDDVKLNSQEKAKLERYVRAAESPLTVFEDIANNRLSREGAETLRVLYPEMYSKLQERVSEELQNPQNKLTYQKKLQLGIIMDTATDSSMLPQNIAALQASINKPEANKNNNKVSIPTTEGMAPLSERVATV